MTFELGDRVIVFQHPERFCGSIGDTGVIFGFNDADVLVAFEEDCIIRYVDKNDLKVVAHNPYIHRELFL